jgi:DNA primase
MSVINDVKQRVDIVELVADYVPLQKAGRNFKALCPFHSEKNPSFFVFPDQQTWHCFGACNTGGDVFSFIMKKEGIDFGQALHLLAQRAGIVLREATETEKAKDEETKRLFEINELASEYYHHLLLDTAVGEKARSYLDSRKITLETIKKFRLGFSPDDWEAIKFFLINKGYEQKDLFDVGLIIEKEDGGSYDRFRERLMFPIWDIKGRITGFGARALDDSQPKYINSPQTVIFDKGSNFYGIDKAKDIIRKENLAIIVEGYMDVLAAHQNGWQNVVASMGISLTERQVNILKRLTKNITLALDADIAGEEATLRSGEILARSLDRKAIPVPLWTGLVRCEGILDAEIKVIPLPSGKDPDEVIIETPKLWQSMVTQALPILEFALEVVINKGNFNKAEDKSLAIQKLLPLLYEVKDPIRQAQYVQKMAHLLKLDESTLMAVLRKMRATKGKQLIEVNHSRLFRRLASSPIEEICLALLFQYPEYRDVVQELEPEFFVYTENRELFSKWQQSQSISELKEKLDTNLLEHLNYLLNKNFPPEAQKADRQRELTDCVLRLQESHCRSLEAKKEAILNLERETQGIDAELAKLEEQGIASSQRIREIFIKQSRAGKTGGVN